MEFFKVKNTKLTTNEIKTYLERFRSEWLSGIIEREQYFLGSNPFVMNRAIAENTADAPDWRVRVSYGRKIINTVAGYLYKPGNIKYNYKSEKFRAPIDEIFTRNKETILSSELGKSVSAQGYGFEMFMADAEQNPKWIIGDQKEIIPFYTNDLDSKLFCFIRFVDTKKGQETSTVVDVYYQDVIEHYLIEKNEVKSQGVTPNIYSNYGPPLNVVKNNKEMLSDFAPVICEKGYGGLIDLYDVMISDAADEVDRFSWAYLLMSNSLKQEDVARIKAIRIFENLDKEGFVKFLTKDIPTQFFDFIKNWVKNEIHQQTHVPDFLEMSTGPLSGAALDRLLYDFEFLCATKETYFKDALLERIKILDSIKNITDAEFVEQDIEIVMQRNRPSDTTLNMQAYTQYKAAGGITDKALIENFAPFIKDADAELKAFDEQQQAAMETFALQQEAFAPTDTEENTDSEENINAE